MMKLLGEKSTFIITWQILIQYVLQKAEPFFLDTLLD